MASSTQKYSSMVTPQGETQQPSQATLQQQQEDEKNFFQRCVLPGSLEQTTMVFIIIAIMGIFNSYYIFWATGIWIGSILIILGVIFIAVVSQTIVRCATHFRTHVFDEIALKAYGPWTAKFTSAMMILTQMGYIIANVILVKTMLPLGLETQFKRPLHPLIANTSGGQTFWAAVFTFGVVMPLSMPRELSSAIYTNVLCLFFGIYLMVAIAINFLIDKENVPYIPEALKIAAFAPKLTIWQGIASSVPLLIFDLMIQGNVAQAYNGMINPTPQRFKKVVVIYAAVSAFMFIVVGYFGYTTWAESPYVDQIVMMQNIMLAPYGTLTMQIALFAFCGALVVISPLCLLPAKDSFEKAFWPENGKMSDMANYILTLFLSIVTFLGAVFITNIGDVMQVAGATVQTAVGFNLPMLFYLKLHEIEHGVGVWTYKRVLAHLVNIGMFGVSVASLYVFAQSKTQY